MSFLKLLPELKKLGCQDETKCSTAGRVLLDLIEVVGLHEMEYKYLKEYDIIYFVSKNQENFDYYLPASSTLDLDFFQLERIQEILCSEKNTCLILSICEPSSTVVYYRLESGWDDK